MMTSDLTLVLSGHIRVPEAADMRPFWRGFIALQRRLPVRRKIRHIVAHSWSPEFAGLVRLVYAPDVELHDRRAFWSLDLVSASGRFVLSQRELNRLSDIWKSYTLEYVLGDALSRARAVHLLETLEVLGSPVLICRWDLDQIDEHERSQLVMDADLPDSYVYLSYSADVDEGYPDAWIVAEWDVAKKFGYFDEFVLKAILRENNYLKHVCVSGWPRALSKARYGKFRGHRLGPRAHTLVSRVVEFVAMHSRGVGFLDRVLRGVIDSCQVGVDSPALTAENSCIAKRSLFSQTLPVSLALNSRALLKYFFASERLREKTRFLTSKDFDNVETQYGQIINPQPLVLLVWNIDEDEGRAIERLVKLSPLTVSAVIVIGVEVRAWVPGGDGKWGCSSLRPDSDSLKDRLMCALGTAVKEVGEALPIVVLPSLDVYLSCKDWFYFNALIKFIIFRNLDYVGMDNNYDGTPSLDFPDLYIAKGSVFLSRSLAASTVRGFRSLVREADAELMAVSPISEKMQAGFAVVAKNGGLFL
jgi:hypothetical protein